MGWLEKLLEKMRRLPPEMRMRKWNGCCGHMALPRSVPEEATISFDTRMAGC